MTMLKSDNSKHKVKYSVFIKIVTFIILSCIYQYNQDENAILESLENGRKLNISLDIRTHRTLAKYEKQNELKNANLLYKTDDNRDNHKLVYRRENNNKYARIKRGGPYNVENYLNSFKYKHSQKSALKELDCYYEKGLFKTFIEIEKLAEKKNISRSKIKRFMYKKYGISLILLSLLPLPGLIFLMIFNKYNTLLSKYCFKGCTNKHDYTGSESDLGKIHEKQGYTILEFDQSTWNVINIVYSVYFIISVIILFCVVFYILVKVIKYERLKANKSKMSAKEYYRFCKGVFI